MSDIAEDLMSSYFTTREGLEKRSLGPPAQRVVEVLLRLSFLQDKTEARVSSLELLADAAIIHKGNLRRVIDTLLKGDVMTERFDNNFFYFEIRPDWQTWHVPRRHTWPEEAAAERALKLLVEEPDPAQLELIEREPCFDAEVSRAFASSGQFLADDSGIPTGPIRAVGVVRGTTSEVVVRGTTDPPHEGIVPGTTTPVTVTGQAKACRLPVQETGQLSGEEERKANPILDEQLERMERAVGSAAYLPWWRKHGGRSVEHTKALRQTLDDYATTRSTVREPVRWLIGTFKKKCSAIAKRAQTMLFT